MAVSAHERHARRTVVLEQYAELGFNFRMTDLQAAVGLASSTSSTHGGRAPADRGRLPGALEGVPGLGLPSDPPHGSTNYQSYVVRLEEGAAARRDAVMQALLEQGIATRRGIMAAHLNRRARGCPLRRCP